METRTTTKDWRHSEKKQRRRKKPMSFIVILSPERAAIEKKRSFVSFQGQIFLGPWCQSASKRVYHWPFRHIHRRDPRVSKRLDVCMCTRTRTLSVSGGPACQPIQPTSTSLHEKEMSSCWLKASCSACEGQRASELCVCVVVHSSSFSVFVCSGCLVLGLGCSSPVGLCLPIPLVLSALPSRCCHLLLTFCCPLPLLPVSVLRSPAKMAEPGLTRDDQALGSRVYAAGAGSINPSWHHPSSSILLAAGRRLLLRRVVVLCWLLALLACIAC